MMRWLRWTPAVMVLLLGLALALPASAQRVKEAGSSLDHIVFARPELRVPETNTDADLLRGRLQNIQDLDGFRAEHGAAWRFTIDERRDRVRCRPSEKDPCSGSGYSRATSSRAARPLCR